jgi:hypothetical protein
MELTRHESAILERARKTARKWPYMLVFAIVLGCVISAGFALIQNGIHDNDYKMYSLAAVYLGAFGNLLYSQYWSHRLIRKLAAENAL